MTQTMLRRFDLTTGKNPEPSGAMNDLAFRRGLICCRFARFLCAIVIPKREAQALECLSLLFAFPDGSWYPCFSKIADVTTEALNSGG